MLDAIRQARHAHQLRELHLRGRRESATSSPTALVDAARRGVTVRIVLDAFGGELSDESRRRS